MKMKLHKRVLLWGVLIAMVGTMLVVPLEAFAKKTGTVSVPTTGTFTDALGGIGTFAGTLTIDRFTRQGGQLLAVGTLTGTLTDSLGAVLGTITQNGQIPL